MDPELDATEELNFTEEAGLRNGGAGMQPEELDFTEEPGRDGRRTATIVRRWGTGKSSRAHRETDVAVGFHDIRDVRVSARSACQ